MSEHIDLIINLVAIFFSILAIFFSWQTRKILNKTAALQAKTVQFAPKTDEHSTFNPDK